MKIEKETNEMMTSREMEEQYLRMLEPTMEERMEQMMQRMQQLEEQVRDLESRLAHHTESQIDK